MHCLFQLSDGGKDVLHADKARVAQPFRHDLTIVIAMAGRYGPEVWLEPCVYRTALLHQQYVRELRIFADPSAFDKLIVNGRPGSGHVRGRAERCRAAAVAGAIGGAFMFPCGTQNSMAWCGCSRQTRCLVAACESVYKARDR